MPTERQTPTRAPALHIGWWRNGFHEYKRPSDPEVPKTDGPVEPAGTAFGPTSGQRVPAPRRFVTFSDDPRETGALYAVAIAGVWSLVTFGFAMPGIPVAGLLGWKFGGSFNERGDRVIPMTVLAVVGTDLLFAAMMGLTLGPAMAIDSGLAAELIPAIAQLLVGFASTTAMMAGLGLLFLGAPGLLIAGISAIAWHHLMRRRFSEPAHEGGDRGSGDPLR